MDFRGCAFNRRLARAAFDESVVSLMKFTEIPVFPLASDGVAGVYFGELKEFRMSASSAPPRPPQGRHAFLFGRLSFVRVSKPACNPTPPCSMKPLPAQTCPCSLTKNQANRLGTGPRMDQWTGGQR